MNKLKNMLSKMRQHISSDEFKSIESIGFLRLIPKVIKVYIFIVLLVVFRWGILDTVKALYVSTNETELAALNMTTSFLYTLLITGIVFVLFFLLAKRMFQQKVYLLIKDTFYLGLTVLITTLPESVNITSKQADYLFLSSLLCCILILILKRVIYLKELLVLIQLGIIDKEKSSIKFYRIKELHYFVNTPDQLTKINHEWLPFVDVVLEGESRTVLNEDWKDKCTSKIYSIVVQSKFSGLRIIHTMGIHGHIERFVTMPTSVSVKESEEN